MLSRYGYRKRVKEAEQAEQAKHGANHEAVGTLGHLDAQAAAHTPHVRDDTPRPSALASQRTDLDTTEPEKSQTDVKPSRYAAEVSKSAAISPKKQRTKRVAQDTPNSSAKKQNRRQSPATFVQNTLALVQNTPVLSEDTPASSEQGAGANVGITNLPKELRTKVFEYLEPIDLFRSLRACETLHTVAVAVLWRHVKLDFTKRVFDKDVTSGWREQKLWKNTKKLTIVIPKGVNAKTLPPVLKDIPHYQIEKIEFASPTVLGTKTIDALARFISKLKNIQVLGHTREVDEKHKPVSYIIRLAQQGAHSKLKEVRFVQSLRHGEYTREDLHSKPIDSSARATSLEVFGYTEFGPPLTGECFNRLTVLGSKSLLDDVTTFHFKNVSLSDIVPKISENNRHMNLENVERLALSDCPGAHQFLTAIRDLMPRVKSFLLCDSSSAVQSHQSCYDFLDGKTMCEEVCLDFVQDAVSTPAGHPCIIPTSVAGNVKKLYLKVATPTTAQTPGYLVEIVKNCPKLTHVAFILNNQHSPSITGQTTLVWKQSIEVLGTLLKDSVHLQHIHLILPEMINEHKTSIQSEVHQTAAMFAEKGLEIMELAFDQLHHKRGSESVWNKVRVYKVRHHDEGVAIAQAEDANDWTKLGYSGSLDERVAKVSAGVK